MSVPNLCHLLSVGLWIKRCFGQENGMFFGGDSQFVIEGVVPYLLHIVPIGHNSVFYRVLQSKDTSLALSFIADVRVLLTHTDHYSLMSGSAHNRWERSSGRVIAGKACFTHTGPVVDDQCRHIFVIVLKI